jgi:hypothetical protein
MWILASRRIGARWAKYYGCRTHCLGIHRTAGSPTDAPDEPLASSTVGASVDDPGHKNGRWLALVRARRHAVDRWRPSEVFGDWGGWVRRHLRDFRVQSIEKTQPAAAALPVGAALLVEGSSSGPVFVSLRPHHDGVLYRAGSKLLLSVAGRAALLLGYQHRRFPHCFGNAFLERRAGRHGCGRGAGVRFDYDVCVAWMDLGLGSLAGLAETTYIFSRVL